jgi:hypothetical protein
MLPCKKEGLKVKVRLPWKPLQKKLADCLYSACTYARYTTEYPDWPLSKNTAYSACPFKNVHLSGTRRDQ